MSRAANSLADLIARCEADAAALPDVREAGDALAAELGGELAWRWELVVMKATMANPPDADAVRELYGELVDRHRDEPARLAALKPLGDEIRRREADGSLPSTLVARSDRRPRR
jgi:hypothetical protein